MTGVSSNNQFNDPSFLANLTQKDVDDLKTITTGPGGAPGGTTSLTADMISIFQSLADQGMPGSSKDLGIGGLNASGPSLDLPTVAPFTLSPSALDHFLSSIMPQVTTDTTTQPDFGFDALADLTSGLKMPVPGDLGSKIEGDVFNALLSYTKIDSDPGLTPDQKTAFKELLHEMAASIAAKNSEGTTIPELASGDPKTISNYLASIIPKNSLEAGDLGLFKGTLSGAANVITANEFLIDLQSKDPKAVAEGLKSFIAVSPEQKSKFGPLVEELATNIATQNASGKADPALSSFDPEVVSKFLLSQIDISSLPKADQTTFTGLIQDAGTSIGALNAATGTQPAKSAVLQGVESTDPEKVLSTLKSTLASQNMSQADIEALTPQLTELANKIAEKTVATGGGLNITDADTLKQVLANLLGPSNDVANAKLQKAIAALATVLAAENTAYFTVLSKSTDPAVVLTALRALSNVDNNPNLSPAERRTALNYLALMAQALAFMSQVRAKVAMLEAELRKAENEGKLAIIKDQTQAASRNFEEGLKKIEKDISSQLEALRMKALMAILGPIIMVIIAIIMAIITIFSFGTAAPVAAAIMVAVIVVMTVIAIADMQTGMFEKAGKACSSDPAGQKAASFGFQAIIMAIMIVFSFGLASFAVAAQQAAQSAARAAVEITKEVIKEIIKSVIKQLLNQGLQGVLKTGGQQLLKEFAKEGIIKNCIMFVAGEMMSLLFSSGLLTEGFVKMFKAMGMNDKDADMAAMIMSIVVMLVMMVAMVKAAGSIGKSLQGVAKTAIKEGTDIAEETLEVSVKETMKKSTQEALETAAKTADNAATAGTKGVASKMDEVLENIVKQLQKKLMDMKEIVKDPDNIVVFLEAFALLAQVGQGVGMAVHHFKQAENLEAQAKIELLQSQAQALIDMLKQITPQFDITLKDIDDSSKEFMKGYTELMGLFADMVSSASAIVSTTTQTA